MKIRLRKKFKKRYRQKSAFKFKLILAVFFVLIFSVLWSKLTLLFKSKEVAFLGLNTKVDQAQKAQNQAKPTDSMQLSPAPSADSLSADYFLLGNQVAFFLPTQNPEKNPAQATIIDEHTVRLNNVDYVIAVNSFSNLCPADDSKYRCDYQDESWKEYLVTTVRSWRQNKNVFALQALAIRQPGAGDHPILLDNILLTKKDGQIFSIDEVKLWKDILAKNLQIIN